MSNRIKKKFIDAKAIDGSKLLFLNDESFKAVNHLGTEQALFKMSTEGKFVFETLPQHSSDPTAADELARKAYVDLGDLTEQSAREAAVDSLEAAIAALSSEVSANLAAETSARIAGDAALEADIAEEVNILNDAIDTIAQDMAAEQSARQAGDEALDARLDILEGSDTTAGSVAKALKDAKDYTDAEKVRAETAEAGLQSQINTEKGRVDAILLAADADKDSFAEIVALINSVDTTNDSAFASYVLSNDAALAAEVTAREAADLAEQSARVAADTLLQSNIDAEATARAAADLAEQSARVAAVSAEESARIAGDLAEQSARVAAVALLNSSIDDVDGYAQDVRDDLDQEILDRAAAVSAEESARIAGDLAEQSARVAAVAAEESARIAGDLAEQSARVAAVAAEASARAAAVSAEESARIAGDADLQSQINTEKGRVDAILLAADADKDSFAEIVALINSVDLDSENSLAGAISSEASARAAADALLQSNIDAEATARANADGVLQNNIDSLGDRFAQQSFVLDAPALASGSVLLSHKAFEFSMVVSVDRLMLLQGVDYTVLVTPNDGSPEGNKTRIAFTPGFMTGDEAPSVGDRVVVRYLKDVR